MDKVKALAIELGLVEKFTVASSKCATRCETRNGISQTYEYVIVIDFESTCWDSKDQSSRWQHLPEIIEFPAVLLNVKTGFIEDQFHHYIMPVENPTLSEFCVKLTGISQEVVNSGIPLGTCIMLFNQWIRKVTLSKKLTFHRPSSGCKVCTFVTWSDWDLAVCLQNEIKRKQLRKPEILSQWIDLRHCYRKFYQRKPQGLKGALAELGLPFTGREHSGIIDAKNTANLVHKMVKDGLQLEITSSSELTSPTTNLKRCPLVNLKNTSTPLSREPSQSLRTRALKGALNNSKHLKNHGPRSPHPSTAIYKEEQGKRVSNRKETPPQNASASKRNSCFTTPDGTSTPKRQNVTLSSCRRTPPLCRCGRRAASRVSNSPGPNLGRSFFTCPNQRRSLGMVSKGCSFFMWF